MKYHDNIEKLLNYEKQWNTDLGAFFPEQGVIFRGKDLFSELKDISWIHLLLHGITGRIFNEKQVHFFERLWVICTSYPDPRIWVNRVAALAGTTRAALGVGVGAATSVFDAKIYGGTPTLGAIDFMIRAHNNLESGGDLKTFVKTELKTQRVIFGYGRPVARGDERLEPISALARELDFDSGPHVQICRSVEKILVELQGKWALKMNAAALIGALAADQGLSAREFYYFMSFASTIGVMSCYVDANDKPEGAFFPFRCNCIQYEGVKNRKWNSV